MLGEQLQARYTHHVATSAGITILILFVYARRVPEECPQAVANLISQCMDAEPAVRPSAKEVVSLLMQPDAVLARSLPNRRRSAPERKVCTCVLCFCRHLKSC